MPYRIPNVSSLPSLPISNIKRKYGWKRKERSHPKYRFFISKTQPAISKVDLRPWCPPVYDQGELGSCHDDQTEILTENGWILFENLTGTEKLATVNPETAELIYETPIRLIKLPYEGDIITGKNTTSLDFKVTPDHKMMIQKWNSKTKRLNPNYEFTSAKDIGWYSGLMNTIYWKGDKNIEESKKKLFHRSSAEIKEFLLSYFKQNNYIVTESLELANELQLLIFLSGSVSEIKVVNEKYRVSMRNPTKLSINKKNNITSEPYKGFVYCAEVPTYHTLVTRRNYRILISGNCTANTIAAAYEFDEIKQKNKCDFRPSRLYIYYGERVKENSVFQDDGADVADGVEFISASGVCPESLPENNTLGITTEVCWPYDIGKFSWSPPKQCFDFAQNHKALQFRCLNQSLNQLKQGLIEGFPITMGFEVYAAFEGPEVARTGLVPIPSFFEMARGSEGGHCVLIVGYDDDMMVHGEKGAFIVRNSWGPEWGDKGYFYMSYKYVLNERLACDFWIISKISD